MLRHKNRKLMNRNSVFLAHEQWQYSGNAFKRISQVCFLKLVQNQIFLLG